MSNKEKPEKKEAAKSEPKSIFREYFESLVTTLVMAIFGMTFVIQAVTVPTGSMQNTILIDDYFLVNKFIFPPESSILPFLPQRPIERGDIIVFKYPGFRKGEGVERVPVYKTNYIKRVIGLPGDKVEFKDNHVYVNDALLPEHRQVTREENSDGEMEVTDLEPRKPEDKYSVTYSARSVEAAKTGQGVTARMNYAVAGKPMVVPENQYLVMGDNRDNSEDGRFWGFVPRELVIGRAMFVYWSCDREKSNGDLGGCFLYPRLDRIGKVIR